MTSKTEDGGREVGGRKRDGKKNEANPGPLQESKSDGSAWFPFRNILYRLFVRRTKESSLSLCVVQRKRSYCSPNLATVGASAAAGVAHCAENGNLLIDACSAARISCVTGLPRRVDQSRPFFTASSVVL